MEKETANKELADWKAEMTDAEFEEIRDAEERRTVTLIRSLRRFNNKFQDITDYLFHYTDWTRPAVINQMNDARELINSEWFGDEKMRNDLENEWYRMVSGNARIIGAITTDMIGFSLGEERVKKVINEYIDEMGYGDGFLENMDDLYPAKESQPKAVEK